MNEGDSKTHLQIKTLSPTKPKVKSDVKKEATIPEEAVISTPATPRLADKPSFSSTEGMPSKS